MYKLSQADGVAKYGGNFQSASELVRIHLYGAASKECDHWHDDAGMLTHHVSLVSNNTLCSDSPRPATSTDRSDVEVRAVPSHD
jgi:hypothetical protein